VRFIDIDEHMEDMLRLQLHSSLLSIDDMKLIVHSSQNELESLIVLLKELQEYLPVLEKDFRVSESKKADLSYLALHDPQDDVKSNYQNLMQIIGESNEYFDSISKLFVGYHASLQKIEQGK
jgi:hypothetical protein